MIYLKDDMIEYDVCRFSNYYYGMYIHVQCRI